MRLLWLGLAAGCMLAGCKAWRLAGARTEGHGEVVTLADLKPDASPGATCTLALGKLQIPVQLVESRTGNDLMLALVAHGQTFETESYVMGPDSFDLKSDPDETFEPPMPLLESPMRLGSSWSWSGAILSGVDRSADARIATRPDQIVVDGKPQSAVLVEASIVADSGGPTPAKRLLRFWFVKGRGLVRRDLGASSSRLPGES